MVADYLAEDVLDPLQVVRADECSRGSLPSVEKVVAEGIALHGGIDDLGNLILNLVQIGVEDTIGYHPLDAGMLFLVLVKFLPEMHSQTRLRDFCRKRYLLLRVTTILCLLKISQD